MPAKPTKKPAPKAEAPAIEVALPEGAVTDSPASGSYTRVKVNGMPIGYVSDRKAGKLVEVLTSRLVGCPAKLLKGAAARQNQTALMVRDEATAEQAREIFAFAADSLKEREA